MPAAVKLLSNEPILALKFSGEVDSQFVVDTYVWAAEQAQTAGGALYWLVDVRDSSADVIASALKEIVMGVSDAPIMPQVNMAFIAQPDAQVNAAWAAGWFSDEESALNHARAQVAEALHTH
jgi:hypothetical protein